MAWVTPRTWTAGELVTADTLNAHVRNQFRQLGEAKPGDLKITYRTHANAITSTLTEMEEGWFICNGATYAPATYPQLHAALGSPGNPLLPDFRGRMFVAPGTQDGHAFARGAVGGEYDHTLSEAELPAHTHTPQNASHSHGLTNASHTHTSPAHTHSITDVQHGHTLSGAGLILTDSGAYGRADGGSSLGAVSINNAYSGITGTNGASVTIDAGGGSISVDAGGGSLSLAATGAGNAHATMSPFLVGGAVLILRDW